MKTKAISLLMVLSLVIVMVAGCGGQSAETNTGAKEQSNTTTSETSSKTNAGSDDKILIGVTSMTMKESVYQFMRDNAMKKAEELGATLMWQSCENDPQVQLNQVDDFIAQKVDVLVIEPARSDAAVQLVQHAKDAGIPVINLEALIRGIDTELRIVADSVKVGELQVTDFVENEWDKKPANVVILSGTKGDEVAENITQGNLNIIEKYPELNVVMSQYHEAWDRALAMNTMQDALAKYNNNIQVVFANNDTMAHGAMKAAKDAGVTTKIVYYGADHDKDSVEAIMAGEPLKVVDKGAIEQGKRIAEAAVKLAKGEELPYDEVVDGIKVWYTPIELIHKDNLKLSKEKFPELF